MGSEGRRGRREGQGGVRGRGSRREGVRGGGPCGDGWRRRRRQRGQDGCGLSAQSPETERRGVAHVRLGLGEEGQQLGHDGGQEAQDAAAPVQIKEGEFVREWFISEPGRYTGEDSDKHAPAHAKGES